MSARELVVPAPPEDVLRRAVPALRRLGARLTRYDDQHGELEARAGRRLLPVVVRLRASAEGAATRVTITSDVHDWRAIVRQVAAELATSDWA
ncbi:MAG: hypothetical protein A3F92_12470 [Candidatus Rokubacteria bacterium RIFCSPLOWO2_12_FULL_71_22]|nr:MAG: hypothetical protein A3F92_12470 [Candidatus Rokubacteria bacterium RIFCSPLOWO2_12_FULL_71_22]